MMNDVARADPSLWQRLVKVAIEKESSEFARQVIAKACDRVVDTVASALASAAAGEGSSAGKVALAEPGAGTSSVWVSGGATRCAAMASLANGTLAHATDYDDTHALSTLHPGVVIVPAAIAVGEEIGAAGRDVLAAISIGYEVAARLASLAPGEFQRQGFQPTAILGIFGATAAVARLKKVPLAVAANAGGIAGSLASGLMEYLADGSDVKQLHAGWMAQGAVRAVQFAGHGLSGPRTVLEGAKGVFRAFISRSIEPDAAMAGFGTEWTGIDVATKFYPACYGVHAAIDAWRLLRDRHGLAGIDARRIRRITGLVPEFYLQLVCEPLQHKRAPRTVYEARFSLPYAIARAVIDGDVGLDSFLPDRLADPEVVDLMQKVGYEVVAFPTFPGEFPGGIRVEMADGRILEAKVERNPGGPSSPASRDQLDKKLIDAATRIGDARNAQRLVDSLRSLCDAQGDLRGFTTSMARFGSAE